MQVPAQDQALLETNLASRWEGVRLPPASGKSPDFPGSSPNLPGSFSATSLKVSHCSQEPLNAPFLNGLFEVKRLLRTKSGKHPIKVGKRPIKEGKRPIKAMVLVGISVGCLMGTPAMAENGPSKKAR